MGLYLRKIIFIVLLHKNDAFNCNETATNYAAKDQVEGSCPDDCKSTSIYAHLALEKEPDVEYALISNICSAAHHYGIKPGERFSISKKTMKKKKIDILFRNGIMSKAVSAQSTFSLTRKSMKCFENIKLTDSELMVDSNPRDPTKKQELEDSVSTLSDKDELDVNKTSIFWFVVEKQPFTLKVEFSSNHQLNGLRFTTSKRENENIVYCKNVTLKWQVEDGDIKIANLNMFHDDQFLTAKMKNKISFVNVNLTARKLEVKPSECFEIGDGDVKPSRTEFMQLRVAFLGCPELKNIPRVPIHVSTGDSSHQIISTALLDSFPLIAIAVGCLLVLTIVVIIAVVRCKAQQNEMVKNYERLTLRVIDNLKESQDGRYAKDKEEKSISVDRRSPTDSLPEPCTMFKSESHSDLLMNSLVNNEDRIYDSVDDLERVLTQAEDNVVPPPKPVRKKKAKAAGSTSPIKMEDLPDVTQTYSKIERETSPGSYDHLEL